MPRLQEWQMGLIVVGNQMNSYQVSYYTKQSTSMWRRVCLSTTEASTSVVDDFVSFARLASKVLL